MSHTQENFKIAWCQCYRNDCEILGNCMLGEKKKCHTLENFNARGGLKMSQLAKGLPVLWQVPI